MSTVYVMKLWNLESGIWNLGIWHLESRRRRHRRRRRC